MATARSIIQGALESLQVYNPGEEASQADAARAFVLLNQMIDSWSNESLSCYAILTQSAPLVVGQSAYTIGPGGNFDMVRPLRLITTQGSCYMLDTNGNKYLMTVVPQDVWNSTTQQNIDSNFPDTVFYDPQYPLGIINVFPVPNISYVMYWDSYLQITEFAGLNSPMILPPGYEKALQDNLALEAAPYFLEEGRLPHPMLIAAASKSKGNIKRTNMRENIAIYDQELTRNAKASWNVYTSSYNR